MTYTIGIDSSTTATKAVLVRHDGEVVGVASSSYAAESPHPLWSEQHPDLWWEATQQAIRRVLTETGTDAADVAGLGLTGQMHGLVLLDEAGIPLRPAILWNDQRTAAECDQIRATVGAERFIRVTGNDALTGFTAPKILWVRNHEPEIFSRTAHVLLPKDYVRLLLTDTYAMDRAGGGGTVLFDHAARTWSPEILEALDEGKSQCISKIRCQDDDLTRIQPFIVYQLTDFISNPIQHLRIELVVGIYQSLIQVML